MPRRARIFLFLALLATMSAIGLSGAHACVTCDSSKNCHAGDEQGGYLCVTGQMSCSLLYKLLGGGCEGNFCRTMEICDNRRLTPVMDAPMSDAPPCGGPSGQEEFVPHE